MASKKSYGKKMGGRMRGLRGSFAEKQGQNKGATIQGRTGQTRDFTEESRSSKGCSGRALKVDSDGGVKTVRGKTHVSDGRIYDNPPR